MADFDEIGLSKAEIFQTVAAIAPGIMHQEKTTAEDAAAKALALVEECVRVTERAFAQKAERPSGDQSQQRPDYSATQRHPLAPTYRQSDPNASARAASVERVLQRLQK